MLTQFKKKYIGNWDFYKMALLIAIPMIVQNMITNFVSMLDNIMVGQVGTVQMSGVSIVNQFIFVFNLTIFGGLAGASIFGTQFFGKKDAKGQQYTIRFRLMLIGILICLGIVIFTLFGDQCIGLFLSKDSDPVKRTETLRYGRAYLSIMRWCLIPFGIGQVYASGVRECGETKVPMYGSMAAIGINLILDYGLIFGKFGLPEMGVEGAAIATVIAKVVEAAVMIFWSHTHPDRIPFIKGLYSSMYIPRDLLGRICKKGYPLLINEFLWSMGMSVVAQCYSVRGLDVVAANTIAHTISNLFGVIYLQMGCAIGIIVGARLGADDFEAARDTTNKLIFFAVAVTMIISVCMLPVAYFFPRMYRTEDTIRQLATFYITVQALTMPLWSYTNACYFVLRSGGKTGITFLFDCAFTWGVLVPLAFCVSRFTNIDIHILWILVSAAEIVKVTIGYFMVKSGIWMQNIVA